MPTDIVMPQLGESVVDGTVAEWLKQVGEPIEEYEPIVRISTDKVDSEIPAPAGGVLLEIRVPEGETVDAGVVLGIIGQPDEKPGKAPSGSRTDASNGQRTPQPTTVETGAQRTPASVPDGAIGAHVTPVVARMAAEHQLDLSQITGSGRNGRITKKDVLAYLEDKPTSAAAAPAVDVPPWEQPVDGDLFKPTVEYTLEEAPARPAAPQPTPQPTPPAARPPATPPQAAAPAPKPTTEGNLPGELLAISGMRRSIAEHMVHSKLHTAPHVTTVFEADLSAIVAHRDAHKAALARQGVKLTFTPYFVAACVSALQAYPILHARYGDDGIFQPHVINVGMAVALDDGLIVPVLKNAQDYSLAGLARQVNDLAERARSKQLKPDEVRDGTFTITNHGVSGSLFATPIINQPQSAILGIGAIEKRVKVIDDAIAIRPCAYLSLTFDHRLIDGATADHFVAAVKAALENW